MKKTMRLTTSVMAIFITVFLLSSPLFAQDSQTDASKKAEAEMTARFGKVPLLFKALPDHLRAGAWELFKAQNSPKSAIPPKYRQLISLGVASQIPCTYCIYVHTILAKMLGATDVEIQEAAATAANTRYWSTVMYGAEIPLDEFKKEWDGILARWKKQREAKGTTKK